MFSKIMLSKTLKSRIIPCLSQSVRSLNILFLCDSFNSLSQRAFCELQTRGHGVSVQLAVSEDHMRQAVKNHNPDLIIAPQLTSVIPQDIYTSTKCLVVHPGIVGDRGPSALDWAILSSQRQWGVTVQESTEELDAGPIWATRNFPMPREGSKSSIYNNVVTPAAMEAIQEAVNNFQKDGFVPKTLDYSDPEVKGRLQPPMKQSDRQIDWDQDSTARIKRKIDASDGRPGVLDDRIFPEPYYLFGAHEERNLHGKSPGKIIGKRNGAVCVATVDGAVWISHLKRKVVGTVSKAVEEIKLPATLAARRYLDGVFKIPMTIAAIGKEVISNEHFPIIRRELKTYREISYEEHDKIGVLNFEFYNGAMSSTQCNRLTEAYEYGIFHPIDILIISGGGQHPFSNGIHLNVIEASTDPADEAWKNIIALNNFVGRVLRTENKVTICAIGANAGAGGVMSALAADYVVARKGVILNPHYSSMGLHGSDFWTYSLARRVGQQTAEKLVTDCLPIDADSALKIGLIDEVIGGSTRQFRNRVIKKAKNMRKDVRGILARKRESLTAQHLVKPLSTYEREELNEMRKNIFENNLGFEEKRKEFCTQAQRAELD